MPEMTAIAALGLLGVHPLGQRSDRPFDHLDPAFA